MNSTEKLIELVEQWGEDKGLTGFGGKATIKGQYDKLKEEFEELGEALSFDDFDETVDAIGDMTVVLILLSKLVSDEYGTPVSLHSCLQGAYDIISKRTGKMVDGVFYKDA